MTLYLIRIVRFDFRRTNWVDLLQGVGTEVGVGCVAINPVWLEFLDSISATKKKQPRKGKRGRTPPLPFADSVQYLTARHAESMCPPCTNALTNSLHP